VIMPARTVICGSFCAAGFLPGLVNPAMNTPGPRYPVFALK
jgi:hypothetical protein